MISSVTLEVVLKVCANAGNHEQVEMGEGEDTN
jgi:hypothetical protein